MTTGSVAKLERIASELNEAVAEAKGQLVRRENEIEQLQKLVMSLKHELISERMLKSSWERCARRFKHNQKEALELLRQLTTKQS